MKQKRQRKPRPPKPPKERLPIPPKPTESADFPEGSWFWLFARHNMGYRPVSIAALRDSFTHISWRKWKNLRELAGVPYRARLISEKSALILNLLASSDGQATPEQCANYVMRMAKSSPATILKILEGMAWGGRTQADDMLAAINGINPAIDAIYRQRIYEWFERAGSSYSAKQSYSYEEVRSVAAVAELGIGRGEKRKTRRDRQRKRPDVEERQAA